MLETSVNTTTSIKQKKSKANNKVYNMQSRLVACVETVIRPADFDSREFWIINNKEK